MITDQKIAEITLQLAEAKWARPGKWKIALGSGNHECTAIFAETVCGATKPVCDVLPDWVLKEYPDIDIGPVLNLIDDLPGKIRNLLDTIFELKARMFILEAMVKDYQVKEENNAE